MNYLGHAFLSFEDAEILTGNMIGDHVKGRLVLDSFPPKIKQGILLHRKIDEFADMHPATQRAKIWFRPDYGLYSGAIMDTLYDHFLANDPKLFASEQQLKTFTEGVYEKMELQREWMPESFAEYFGYMRTHNWLYNYRNMPGIQRALNGLARRAQHMAPPEKAYNTFVVHYYELGQCYYELIDDIIKFVKIELTKG